MANKTIKIGDNRVQFSTTGTLSNYSIQILSDIMSNSGNQRATITSLQRDAANQARVMYNNLQSKGVQSQIDIYKAPGEAVIYVYVESKAAGNDPVKIKQDMTDKINELGPTNVSRHASNPDTLQVMDIGQSSLRNKGKFLSVARADGRVSYVLSENNAIHIEIPQPTDSKMAENIEEPKAVVEKEEKEKKVHKWTNNGDWDNLTPDELWKEKSFIGHESNIDVVMEYEHEGTSNHKRLWNALDRKSRKNYGAGDESYDKTKDYPLTTGVTLYLPIGEVSITVKYTSNITTTKIENGARYYPKLLKYISLDPGYVPAYKNLGVASREIYPRLKVYAWSRVRYLEGRNAYIDVTPFVQSMSISSSFEGTEFSLKLMPAVGRLVSNAEGEEWESVDVIDISDDHKAILGNINRESQFSDSRAGGKSVIGAEYVRNNQIHEKVFQQNDMFFIRFEQLKLDSDKKLENAEKVGKEWYDTIGLVDYVDINSTAQNTDASINVVGRDLTKTFIEDNTYFNPYSIGHSESLYGGDVGSNGRYLTNSFQDISALADRSITQSLEYLFHRIASIGYVPDDIFDSFPDKTEMSIFRTVKKSDENKSTSEIKRVKGVWQLVKFWIDDNIKDLRLVDDSIANPQGSVWDLMKKICQAPLIELFTETLGSTLYVIARKPPFEQSHLSKIVGDIQKDTEGIDRKTGETVDFKLVGGTSDGARTSAYEKYLACIEKKKPISVPKYNAGVNVNWQAEQNKKKLAASEIIEVSSDEEARYLKEYGAVIVDDKITNCTEGLKSIQDEAFPLIINISEDDVFRDSFRRTQTAFSWYQINDRGNFAGQNTSLGHVPSIYFDEYAQVFGNRKMEVTSNYSDYRFFEGKEDGDEANLFAEQASQLLSFLVETNIHLPFTREGSFTMNGDRRIKKGNYIYYRPTREVFYVERVTNSMSIEGSMDRTTTVNVSRGMIIDYIDGVEEDVFVDGKKTGKKLMSYFNLVNIQKLKDGVYDTVNGGAASDKFDYKADMLIDTDVMNFFLRNRQFKD